ncbi:MAG: hypothetical protein ACRCXT_18925 [Paraclostridium sp.]
MPVYGTRRSANLGSSYLESPLAAFAEQYQNTIKNILTESSVDIFTEPNKVALYETANDAMRNFFVENSADVNGMTSKEYDDHIEMMNEMYLNDRETLLEYSHVGQHNPVIGMMFPMHKNLMMNNIFEKVVPKGVAVSPKFTLSMETRTLVTPDGKEIDLWKQQSQISEAVNKTLPYHEVELTLPEFGKTDILEKIGAGTVDNLSIDTAVSAVLVAITKDVEGTQVEEDTWIPCDYKFKPGYGHDFDRQFMAQIPLGAVGLEDDVLSGSMHKNRINLYSARGIVKSVKLKTRKDSSNGLTQTCSVKWSSKTDIYEIPDGVPISVPVSPEETKDLAALYDVNQITKIMSMIDDVMKNVKDDNIKAKLDESYDVLPEDQKTSGVFDFKPREGYSLDSVEWRHKMFFDYLDSHITDLLEVLNDPNMTVSIVGRNDLIRKITPTTYDYKSPANIGPVSLEYNKTIMTSDNRVYQFVSSSKIKGNKLIILLNPRNTDRIIYKVVDYQMYVGNDIKNATYYTLPAVTAFERYMFLQYQPVQGRVEILNPSGL